MNINDAKWIEGFAKESLSDQFQTIAEDPSCLDILVAAALENVQQRAEIERLRAEVEAATDHVRALVAAMAEWGTWEDGVPSAGRDSGCGTVGDRYDAARAYLATKGADHD